MTSDEFIKALRDVDSATVANAIEGLRVRDRTLGYADCRLRRLVAQPAPMVGFAITCKVDSTTPGGAVDRGLFAKFLATVARAPGPSVVVCQESGPRPEKGCHMGDVVGTKIARDGAVGVVSGSGVRDLTGMRAVGLSAFALGTVAAHGVWTITDINVDVEVAGMQVRPGDLLHGDENGVITVPADEPEKLLRLISEVQAKESASRRDDVVPHSMEH
jgi:regulator of RNase E activity RraA